MDLIKGPEPPPQRSSGLMAVLMLATLAGTAFGVFAWQRWTARQEPSRLEDSGLDLSQVEEEAPEPPPPAPAPAGGPAIVRLPIPAPPPPSRASRPPAAGTPASGAKAANVMAAVRRNEGRYERLAREYTRKHPVIRQYGRDWMGYPDLKRFNDEYFMDHDPIKFARSVASSPNFAALVQKYANRPEMIAFAKDAAKIAPAELMTAIQDYLKTDNNALKLVQRFAAAIGLPPYLIAGLLGGDVDPNKATAELLRSNPQLQELLQGQKRKK